MPNFTISLCYLRVSLFNYLKQQKQNENLQMNLNYLWHLHNHVADQPCLMKVTCVLATKNTSVIQLQGSKASAEEAPEKLEGQGLPQVIDTVFNQPEQFKLIDSKLKWRVSWKSSLRNLNRKRCWVQRKRCVCIEKYLQKFEDLELYSDESMNPELLDI